MCDDYMHAEKSKLAINFPQLIQRSNILSLDFGNNKIFSFSSEGEFFLFSMDVKNKTIVFEVKRHMDEFFI